MYISLLLLYVFVYKMYVQVCVLQCMYGSRRHLWGVSSLFPSYHARVPGIELGSLGSVAIYGPGYLIYLGMTSHTLGCHGLPRGPRNAVVSYMSFGGQCLGSVSFMRPLPHIPTEYHRRWGRGREATGRFWGLKPGHEISKLWNHRVSARRGRGHCIEGKLEVSWPGP